MNPGNPRRLAHSSSPYLRQHADNPVEWFPWCTEAFEKARLEDKPVFLSIGYSTCHWCHVMAHESFEDQEVAEFLNRHFVSIKLDREERPDIDHVYMGVCQALTGSGGWPLTLVMTPDKKPFFAGTYFPRMSQYGRPGILDILGQLHSVWSQDKGRVIESAERIVRHMREARAAATADSLGEQDLHNAQRQYEQMFDERNGGFGSSPKFPTPHNLLWLLRRWRRHRDPRSLHMAEHTLTQMARGGIHDHLGGGFHRYSTDAHWIVPHFEKMLYDQALLAMAYTEAWQVTRKALYMEAARGIFTYVLRDLGAPGGGFYSAEDADTEGVEGQYFVWRPEDITALIGPERAAIFCKFYDVTSGGNFHEPHGPKAHSILHVDKDLETFAREHRLDAASLGHQLAEDRRVLLEARGRRARPGLDDKLLTDWNGLMLAALAKAALAFGDSTYQQKASECADFIRKTMTTDEGRLLHSYGRGMAGAQAFLDDHAFYQWGLIELHQATNDQDCLDEALRVQALIDSQFAQGETQGYRMTPADGEQLFITPMDVYDGAIPSGNSVMAFNLLRIAQLTGRMEFHKKAQGLLQTFASQVAQSPASHAVMMMALDLALGPATEITITGDLEDPEARDLFKVVKDLYLPHAVVIHKPSKGPVSAQVCNGSVCQAPVTTAQLLAAQLA
ncbi:MAG: thioredoxin domain-containing protein [Planctomycetota bacterium]